MRKYKLLVALLPMIVSIGFSIPTAPVKGESHGNLWTGLTNYFHHYSKKKKNKITLLFVQRAKSAIIDPKLYKHGCYQLRLNHLYPSITYFSNSPERRAGRISNKDFMTVWWHNDYKQKLAPNVAILGVERVKGHLVHTERVAVISNPSYNPVLGSINYQACNLQGKVPTGVMHLKRVVVFIDEFHPFPP